MKQEQISWTWFTNSRWPAMRLLKSRKPKKRPGVGNTSVSTNDYQKALKDVEKRRLECVKLQMSNNKYKGHVRDYGNPQGLGTESGDTVYPSLTSKSSSR